MILKLSSSWSHLHSALSHSVELSTPSSHSAKRLYPASLPLRSKTLTWEPQPSPCRGAGCRRVMIGEQWWTYQNCQRRSVGKVVTSWAKVRHVLCRSSVIRMVNPVYTIIKKCSLSWKLNTWSFSQVKLSHKLHVKPVGQLVMLFIMQSLSIIMTFYMTQAAESITKTPINSLTTEKENHETYFAWCCMYLIFVIKIHIKCCVFICYSTYFF